jgi:hypothetical protein
MGWPGEGAYIGEGGLTEFACGGRAGPRTGGQKGKVVCRELSYSVTETRTKIYLMALQSILPRKGFTASTITEIGLVAAMSFNVAL